MHRGYVEERAGAKEHGDAAVAGVIHIGYTALEEGELSIIILYTFSGLFLLQLLIKICYFSKETIFLYDIV